ncbi:Beta-glucuronidase [Lamellibrachia satsuma]|nr:Beta-glucuronidase [Lamellibrachia satsuma]
MLYPRESETRNIQELDGMWNFRADTSAARNVGMKAKWFEKPLAKTGPVIPMPVPSSFNDITTDRKLQNFVGWAWYDREFYAASDWKSKRVVLRIDSAHYYTVVWVNGRHVMDHEGGHLPFEEAVNANLKFGQANRVTVAVNNTLSPHTLPPGSIEYMTDTNKYPPGYFVQNFEFDFFNYAGIHRRVRLYTTPEVYVSDITITSHFIGSTGYVRYAVKPGYNESLPKADVEILDRDGETVARGFSVSETVTIPNVTLWWPYSMSTDNFGYMYTLKVMLKSSTGLVDVYRQPFGVRTLNVTDTQILINNKPFYCHGAAKHEDSDIRGKGLDFPLIARDFAMLKWLGVNCFRTSHYPYAEEIMDQADAQGIAVIDESPGVGIRINENFGNQSLQHHLAVMKELVQRDKNRPSVIMWSVANEPASNKPLAQHYFKSVISYTKSLDPTRPVTFVSSAEYNNDLAAQYTDVQCINRYYGWYHDTGHLETIPFQLTYDLEQWYKTFKKPLIITEYGADTVPGLHTMPSYVFTEDYQVDFMREYHAVFDVFRKKYLAGEMVWNFADFMTVQAVKRVVGNKKGVLTRQRQPKAAAHVLRQRYWSLINETLSHIKIPSL